MAKLEDLKAGARVRGLSPGGLAKAVQVEWFGDQAVKVSFEDATGAVKNRLVYRADPASGAASRLCGNLIRFANSPERAGPSRRRSYAGVARQARRRQANDLGIYPLSMRPLIPSHNWSQYNSRLTSGGSGETRHDRSVLRTSDPQLALRVSCPALGTR